MREPEMEDVVSICEDTLDKLKSKPPRTRMSESGRVLGMSDVGEWREDCERLEKNINEVKSEMAWALEDGGRSHHPITITNLMATFSYASYLDHKYKLR